MESLKRNYGGFNEGLPSYEETHFGIDNRADQIMLPSDQQASLLILYYTVFLPHCSGTECSRIRSKRRAPSYVSVSFEWIENKVRRCKRIRRIDQRRFRSTKVRIRLFWPMIQAYFWLTFARSDAEPWIQIHIMPWTLLHFIILDSFSFLYN